jgi:hypothetical protein
MGLMPYSMIKRGTQRPRGYWATVLNDDLPDYETYKAQFKDEPEFIECPLCAALSDADEFTDQGARWCSDGHIWIPHMTQDVRGCDGSN